MLLHSVSVFVKSTFAILDLLDTLSQGPLTAAIVVETPLRSCSCYVVYVKDVWKHEGVDGGPPHRRRREGGRAGAVLLGAEAEIPTRLFPVSKTSADHQC